MSTPARRVRSARRTIKHLFAFLSGESTYEGVWFGEPHPVRKGMFWWRPLLRTALKEAGFRI